MIAREYIETHLLPEEERVTMFSAHLHFIYVPHATPDGDPGKGNGGVVAITNQRILICFETGTVNKRLRIYSVPLSHINAMWTRSGPTKGADSPIMVVFPAGLCCQITLEGEDKERIDELERLLAGAMTASGCATEPVDDEGALAAIQHYEEEYAFRGKGTDELRVEREMARRAKNR